MLHFVNYNITFQEVPDEVSLCFDISNCQIRCPGCHSKYLWDDIGENFLDNIENIVTRYSNYITCVCFMGGTHDMPSLERAASIVKKFKLKVCLYTGEEESDKFKDILRLLDYVKFGPYIDEFGGLDKKTTNQRFYKIENCQLIDKTYLFQKEMV